MSDAFVVAHTTNHFSFNFVDGVMNREEATKFRDELDQALNTSAEEIEALQQKATERLGEWVNAGCPKEGIKGA